MGGSGRPDTARIPWTGKSGTHVLPTPSDGNCGRHGHGGGRTCAPLRSVGGPWDGWKVQEVHLIRKERYIFVEMVRGKVSGSAVPWRPPIGKEDAGAIAPWHGDPTPTQA